MICCLYRQIIARGLLDVFRDFSHNEEDYLTVMAIVVRLSEDTGEIPVLYVVIPEVVLFLHFSIENTVICMLSVCGMVGCFLIKQFSYLNCRLLCKII